MRTSQELDRLREHAIMLRRAGKSRRQIKQILGPLSNGTLNEAPPRRAATRVDPTAQRQGRPAGQGPRAADAGHGLRGDRRSSVIFTNSDPALIRFFLRFLDATGTPRTDLGFRVYIHENADVESAQQFWLEITDAPLDQFLTPTLKHHNPKTVRKNVGESYHGCLRIDVRRSADLYRRIEGWAGAIMSGQLMPDGQASNPLMCSRGRI